MKCKLCEEFYKKYPLVEQDDEIDGNRLVHKIDNHFTMSEVDCAFDNGVFTSKNWGCKTMGKLRDLCGFYEDELFADRWSYRDDFDNGSFGVIPIPSSEDEDVQCGYLVMTWYKDSGATGQAWVMNDDDEPERLTLKTAEHIIKEFK